MPEEKKEAAKKVKGKKMESPPRSILMAELQHLSAVSARNEVLTRELSEGRVTPGEIKDEVEQCVAEQSRIVNSFVALSDDEPALERFSSLMSQIEKNIQLINDAETKEQVESIQIEVSALVQKWSQYLEIIVKGIFEKAPEG
ncbi:MAG: hypothetical protein M1269_01915 [Chloroflexi bacterium]|nr:hypothetical protein [Chloroflexota bacterium]